ncbi:hypothetical protein MPL1032_180106 [Mesorhizobium plurifarium]|uniref:Core-binding (CB) domain-containing protein n=1 Tax=Mesorhizobium plurifarium TaxID=69974 RepID=A0A0K2VUB6_MESPL|nr:hypothetical protein MPL1032_180106 [Mesorhizobium plurifarium]
MVDIGRPWLRFLGWWREPSARFEYQSQLDEYVRWMREERGFTPSTLEQWTRVIGRFLRWCDQTDRPLGNLQAADIDAYFVTQATGRWSRISVANTASALRGFLRYRKAGNVRRQPRRIDRPPPALPTGVSAVRPGLVRRAAHVGRCRDRQAA